MPVVSHEIGQWCVYPELRRDPEVHRLPEAEELRDLPRTGCARTASSGRRATSCWPRASCRRSATRKTSSRRCARPAWRASNCSTCTTSPARAPRWSACSIRSGSRRATSRPRSTAASAGSDRAAGAARPSASSPPTRRSTADIEVAHFGPAPLDRVAPRWRLVGDDGRVAASGSLPAHDHPRRQRHRRSGTSRVPLARPCRAAPVLAWSSSRARRRERLGRLGLSRSASTPRRTACVVTSSARRRRAGAAGRRRSGAARHPAGAGEERRGRAGRARLFEHLLEHGVDRPPGADHARHPGRSDAPALGRVPDRVPQQLAVVVPRDARRRDDPRRPPARGCARSCRSSTTGSPPAARPRLRGAGERRATARHQHRPLRVGRDRTSSRGSSDRACSPTCGATGSTRR